LRSLLNNGHFFGVPRVDVVHRFDCTLEATYCDHFRTKVN
jgi:hypothetical protein